MRPAILWCIRNPIFANLVFVSILIGGFLASKQIHRELFPVQPTDLIEIRVVYPNFQAQEIEEAICIKIEEALQGVSGIEEIRSNAQESLGVVKVTAASGANIDKVLDDIKIKIDSIDNLPDESEKPQIISLVSRPKVIDFVLYGPAPQQTLKKLAQQIKNDLATLSGISEIKIVGVPEYEIAVEVNERALEKYQLTFDQIVQAIQSSSSNITGGSLNTAQGKMNIQIQNRMYTGQEYQNLVLISRENGTQILLKDVAEVYDGFVEEQEVLYVDQQPGVLFKIFAADNANTVKAAIKIKKYIKTKQAEFSQMILDVWDDPSLKVIERQNMLFKNIFMGCVLIIFGLGIFLNVHLSFWVTMGIPFAFSGGIIVLWLIGQTVNMLSLLALIVVLGIVVDDAIVVSESIYQHVEEGEEGETAAFLGTNKVAKSILAAVLTTMIAFVILFFLPGTLGEWGRILATTIITILFFSLFEVFFVLPAHLKHLSEAEKKPLRLWIEKQVERATNSYRKIFEWALDHSITVIAFSTVMIISCMILFKMGQVQIQFAKQQDESHYTSEIQFPPSVPFSTTKKYTLHVANMAKQINTELKENVVEQVYFHARENKGIVGIRLSPAEKRSLESYKIIKAWQNLIGSIPDVLSVYFKGNLKSSGGFPIDVKVTSQSTESLRKVLPIIKKELTQFRGVYNIRDNMSLGRMEIQPKLSNQGRIVGLSEQALGEQLFQGFAGQKALVLQRGQDEVEVIVRYSKENRSRIENLKELRTFHETTLSTVTDWKIRSGLDEIHRENRKRLLNITAGVYQHLTNSHNIIQTLKTDFFPKLREQYPDIEIIFAGEEKENAEFKEVLFIGMIYVFLFIYFILSLTSNSFVQPILILAIVPFGFIGAVYGHWIWGFTMSNVSFFGIVALSGIVVNDSLVLIEQVNVEINNGHSVVQAVKRAGPARFRAIMLTSITTVLGLLPFLFETSQQAKVLIPMALSLGFGVIWATFLTLFLLPVLFLYLNTIRCLVYFIFKGEWPSREKVEPAFQQRSAEK